MNKPISLVYAAKIEQEDDAFVATFRDLPNVFTQGDNYEEALSNAQEALDLLLLDMANDDIEIADPMPCEAGEISVTVNPDVATLVLLHKDKINLTSAVGTYYFSRSLFNRTTEGT